jgi:endoglucanase
MDQIELMLKELTDAVGIAGHEEEVSAVMEKHLKGLGEIFYDRLGSLICKKTGKAGGPAVMLAAHMDEVGFMVKQVTKDGFIKFLPIGDGGLLWSAQRVMAVAKATSSAGRPKPLRPSGRRKRRCRPRTCS